MSEPDDDGRRPQRPPRDDEFQGAYHNFKCVKEPAEVTAAQPDRDLGTRLAARHLPPKPAVSSGLAPSEARAVYEDLKTESSPDTERMLRQTERELAASEQRRKDWEDHVRRHGG